jgi:hypothetical protein
MISVLSPQAANEELSDYSIRSLDFIERGSVFSKQKWFTGVDIGIESCFGIKQDHFIGRGSECGDERPGPASVISQI